MPSAPHEARRIAFFTKENGSWKETKTLSLQPVHGEAVSGFLRELGTLVGDAQAIAGSSIAGIAYSVLNKQGKHIFEITDISPEQLSGIAGDIAMMEAKRKLSANVFWHTRPVETDVAGVYSLDLATALEENPDLSSKMILKPFLKSTPFTELTILCRHVPNWLAQEQTLTITQKQRGETLVVTVTKRLCGEASS